MWGLRGWVVFFCFMFGEIHFEAAVQFSTGEHDAATTAFALQPNIRAETRDRPFVGTARMLFAKSEMVVELQIGEHSGNW